MKYVCYANLFHLLLRKNTDFFSSLERLKNTREEIIQRNGAKMVTTGEDLKGL